MNWFRSESRQIFLQSKVASRIFLLFILCALLPLIAMAVLTYVQVRSQSDRDAYERLREASRTAGMTVFERLSFLETDLDLLASEIKEARAQSGAYQERGLCVRLEARFRGLILLEGKHPIDLCQGWKIVPPTLSEEQRKHIRDGNAVVTTTAHIGGVAAVFIAKAMAAADPAQGILMGEVSPSYLWGGDGFLSPTMQLFAVDPSGAPLFSTLPGQIPARELNEALRADASSGRFEWQHQGDTYVAGYWTLFMRPTFLCSWQLVHSQKKDDIMEPAHSFGNSFLLILLLSFWIVAFLSLYQIRRNMVPIQQLQEATSKIAARDLTTRVRITSKDEFAELGKSFNNMAANLENLVQTMSTTSSIGISLSAEKDADRLLEAILKGVRRVAEADGAALYLHTENRELVLAQVEVNSLNLRIKRNGHGAGSAHKTAAGFGEGRVAPLSEFEEETINIPDIYAAECLKCARQIRFDEEFGYRTHSFLSVPLKNHENEIIGVLKLFNATDRTTGESIAFSTEAQSLAESLASQAAVALTKTCLLDDFRRLFEGLVELLATAIDEKSPYTAGHCKRVHALTMMIAEAACISREGKFKNFSLSPDEMYELKVASMLHDCGKVATPVHIIDKRTKLETICDRIDLIENRFEILRRDRKIALLEAAVRELTAGAPAQLRGRADEALEDFDRELQMDLDFLRLCNQGMEHMPEEMQHRVLQIAGKYTWSGYGQMEKPVLSVDEVHNLTIPRGTLTEEERELINRHVASTIRMLESLHYPKNLRNVPRHAGAHHERMDGSGYPLGLKRDQITLQARMIGIADVFEALTAPDRPYKTPIKLSEAMAILQSMRDEGHIDPDLYDLFVREKVYLRYASEYLDACQQDEVSIEPATVAVS